jgi:hypothetical protein
MATVARVKRLELIDGELDLRMPTEGRVQLVVTLWNEQPSPPAAPGIPLTRSDLRLVIGEDIGPTGGPPAQRYGEAIKAGDIQRLGGYEAFLAERGLTIADFTSGRTGSMDLAVPAALIAAYTG